MPSNDQIREAVAVFTSVGDMENAIDELLSSGFGRAELSMLASSDTVREKLGHTFNSTRELEDNPAVPTTAYIARESVGTAEGAVIGSLMYVGAALGAIPIVASGGTIAAAILAASLAGGGGAAIGSVLAHLIDKHHSDRLNQELEKGGVLLWVRTRDIKHEERAVNILENNGGIDVHVHTMPDKPLDSNTLSDLHPLEGGITTVVYQETQIVKAADGHCYTAGRIFATEADAREFIAWIERTI